MTLEDLRSTAENLANSLGIALNIRDGKSRSNGPGERIDPPKTARSETHGRFQIVADDGRGPGGQSHAR
jgi:hypothetical protein